MWKQNKHMNGILDFSGDFPDSYKVWGDEERQLGSKKGINLKCPALRVNAGISSEADQNNQEQKNGGRGMSRLWAHLS